MANWTNVLSLLEGQTNNYGEKIALAIKTKLGWKEFSYKGLGLLTRKLAYYLINDLQVKKGERLAILSESKPEIGACVFASVISGMVTVPLDNKLTIFELTSILSDCNPTVLMVSQSYIDKALELKNKIESLKTIIVVDEPTYNLGLPSLYTLPDNYDCKWKHRATKSTALIIYTSGTTGSPKGVEISFKNLLSQLNDLKEPLKRLFPDYKKIATSAESINVLSILPMNHLFELTVGFFTFLNFGFSVYYAQSLKPKDILSIMKEKKIAFMIVVPAFLKLLKMSIEAELKNLPKAQQNAFKAMYAIAKYMPINVRRKMFKKIHDKFGGYFTQCISGGAPLDVSVAEFFDRLGVIIYQGYGLTETSPVVSVNMGDMKHMSSVGRALPSYEVKIDKESGELLLRSDCVMKGYYNQPELTASVIDEDNWFHTGDIATLDKEKNIYITGRIKNMIVLNGGKKVFPEEVETVLEKSEYFAEVCVMGTSRTFGAKDGTEDIMAVVVPKDEIIKRFEGDDSELNSFIRAEVKNLSTQLTMYKRPNNVVVLKDPLPKTTTRKVKRKDVKELVLSM